MKLSDATAIAYGADDETLSKLQLTCDIAQWMNGALAITARGEHDLARMAAWFFAIDWGDDDLRRRLLRMATSAVERNGGAT